MLTQKIVTLGGWVLMGLTALADPIAGVDFSNTGGASDPVPDDLNTIDNITVSNWSFPGATGGIIQNDVNANSGRPTAPVAKFNGVVDGGVPPALGAAPPTDGIHQFAITIGAIPLDLTKVTFNFSKATNGGAQRWLAFRTSLDDNLIFSRSGVARPTFTPVEIVFDDPKYEQLTNQTIDFIWYAGGQGTGDIDVDNIVIEGFQGGDSDNDGINDAYEQLIIDAEPNDALETVQDVLPGDDFDNDLSTNLEEFERLTSAIDDDTDDDGLLDGVETDDGSFDDLSSDTGTNPLNPDTDGDGLLDGVETNDGTFDDEMDTGTDPLEANTDGGDFRDGAEVLIHGTDPTDIGSEPTVETEVLFLGGNETGTAGADEVAVALLQDKFGISRVTINSTVLVLAGEEEGFDLLVISSTPGSDSIRNKFPNSPVPIVCWEEAVIDNGAGEFGASSVPMVKSTTTTQMVLADHPIADGLPSTIELFSDRAGETTSSSAAFNAMTVVGTAANGSGGGVDVTGQAMVFAIEAGDAVDPFALTADNIAPARRVLLPFTDNTLAALSVDGLTLFSNVLDWALASGGVISSAELAITGIEFTDVPFPANREVTLEFNSEAGREYEVLSATGLEDFSNGVAPVVSTINGQEGSTTAVVDFTLLGLPLDDAKRFFVVREAAP
ncbi:MAG: hypothetical protein ACON4R_02030 [Akkermansiaceae bacterium]